ncbi:hypothetical protein PHMEG_00012319 [Phytophthora megakarya]|uniref:Uncharacterized protein n=1 Tax=Phytophthora megakarya TaxID=4795 RepID=A0A225WB46_9STRA|nr:hypothetical protein PHMEG_00012319 [Phytophthora megakarya]
MRLTSSTPTRAFTTSAQHLHPSATDTLDPTTAKELSVTKAHDSLTHPVFWDKLCADTKELMRSHMSYDEALAAARTDAEIHSHLDVRHLVYMLLPPWVKYIPCWCYKEAESKLYKTLTSGERKDIEDDAVKIMAALYDSVMEGDDDEGRDATFSPAEDNQNKP